VKINNVPTGVSSAQVILLFTYTVKPFLNKEKRYEFDFGELCPTKSLTT